FAARVHPPWHSNGGAVSPLLHPLCTRNSRTKESPKRRVENRLPTRRAATRSARHLARSLLRFDSRGPGTHFLLFRIFCASTLPRFSLLVQPLLRLLRLA